MAISFKVNGGPAGQIMSAADLHGGFGSPCGLRSRAKGASFGYHRMTLGQLAAAVAQPALTAQGAVPAGTSSGWGNSVISACNFLDCEEIICCGCR